MSFKIPAKIIIIEKKRNFLYLWDSNGGDKMEKREILITNDDGINAKGVNVIADFMTRFGNVTVVAPASPQSAKSASVTMRKEMVLEKLSYRPGSGGRGSLALNSFDGTPADCVKAAMNYFFSLDRRPDFLVSGINHGSNASIASLYSGTLGACAEATSYDIPSIGLSLDTHDEDPDFAPLLHFVPMIMDRCLASPFRKGVYLNINFPALPLEEIKGVRMAHQGAGQWIHDLDMSGREGDRITFIMSGSFVNRDENPDADHLLVSEGYVTVVPHLLDTTDYDEAGRIGGLWKPEEIR